MLEANTIKLRDKTLSVKPCPTCKYPVNLIDNASETFCRAKDGTIIRRVGSISCECGTSVSLPLEAFDIDHTLTWDHVVRLWNSIGDSQRR